MILRSDSPTYIRCTLYGVSMVARILWSQRTSDVFLLWGGFLRVCRFLDVDDELVFSLVSVDRSRWVMDLVAINIETATTSLPRPPVVKPVGRYKNVGTCASRIQIRTL